MNINLILLLTIFIFLPTVSSNFTVLKSLLSKLFSNNSDKNVDDNQPSVTALERSSLISEHDNKLSILNNNKENLFGNSNFISKLQDMLRRNSIETSEQDNIINIDDSDDGDNDLGNMDDLEQNNDGTIDLNNLHKNQFNNGLIKEKTMSNQNSNDDDDDDDDDEEEDSFENRFDKKNIKDQLNQTDNQLENKIVEQLNSTTNQTIQLSNQTIQLSNGTYKSIDNKTVSAYYYLGPDHVGENTNILPLILHNELIRIHPQLLGNTLYSIEKIIKKYSSFLNLYPKPSINDTHNDRDLHQKKEDKVVILKANFADYDGYSNTEKSVINGPAPPVQNLTDIRYGNTRVKTIQQSNIVQQIDDTHLADITKQSNNDTQQLNNDFKQNEQIENNN